MTMGGPQDALQHFERALSWLDENDPERDEVTLRASAAAMVAGEPVRAMDLLRDRLDHPGTAQAPEARADLLATLVSRSRILDLPVDSIALTDEAVSLIGEEADERRVRVLVARVQALVDNGSFVEAAVTGNEVSILAERLGLGGAIAELRTILARVLEANEDLDSVEEHLHAIVADIDRDDPLLLRVLHQLASIRHRRGDLPGALAQYDAGAAVARRIHREWAPWGQECRLLGGLTAYELGDWDGAVRRLDLGGRPAPQPGRSIFTAAMLHVQAGRGDAVNRGIFGELREWWHVDGLTVVLTVMPGIDLLGDTGDVAATIELVEAAVDSLDRAWGEYHAIARIAALVTGQAATWAPRIEPALRRRLVDLVEGLADRAHEIGALRPAVERASRPKFERTAAESLEDTSRETWAWIARLDAELLRLRHAADLDDPPSAAELVDAWRASVVAFDRYGHLFESARSRARLAAALRAAGDHAGARETAERARQVAVRLEAKPLLAELDAVQPGQPGQAGQTGQAVDLTPRELEVLQLVARGLTNGQAGKQLYISTKTVSVHVSNVLAKLGASSRTEAAAIARQRGLVP
jgi:DNA-binding CsgD family transcriptional regulator